MEDQPDQEILSIFKHCFCFLDRGRQEPNRVLVHCNAGVSRSPTVCDPLRGVLPCARATGVVIGHATQRAHGPQRLLGCYGDGVLQGGCRDALEGKER